MRIVTNEKLVKRNTKLAQYLFFFSLAVLILGFFGINYPLLGLDETSNLVGFLIVALPMAILPVALITTLVSVRMTNLWIRRPRPEDALQEGLKGLSNKSVLYNYYHFPARHVLICPQGVFAFVTRFQDGEYSVEGDKWHTRRGFASRIFSIFRMDGIGNPSWDAQVAAKHVRSKLASIAPDVEVNPMVLFVDPRVTLDVVDPVVPVVHTDSKTILTLKDYLRQIKGDGDEEEASGKKGQKKKKSASTFPLTDEQIDAFEAATLS